MGADGECGSAQYRDGRAARENQADEKGIALPAFRFKCAISAAETGLSAPLVVPGDSGTDSVGSIGLLSQQASRLRCVSCMNCQCLHARLAISKHGLDHVNGVPRSGHPYHRRRDSTGRQRP
eukprot:2008496-Rhodomonas_salina.1